MKIHITGFPMKEKEDYIQKIKSLNLIYSPNLTLQTDVLLCESIMLHKYRTAKIINIKIVSKYWLIESYKNKKPVDISNYEFGIFENLKINLFGFDFFKQDKIYEMIKQCNGVPFKDLNKVYQNDTSV